MDNTVTFRDFEERDIDFVFKCKNDEKLNSMIVGDFHNFTYEEAAKWVHGCMGDHETFKFWAVCTNDEEQQIVGWVSLSQIDYKNSSACHHGIVIGDSNYKDGTALFETMLFSMEYAFDVLNIHRLYGSCLSEHKISPHLLNALGFTLEGKERESVFRFNRYLDVLNYSILRDEYINCRNKGAFEISCAIKNFIKSAKKVSK